jgi:hypothetical protein
MIAAESSLWHLQTTFVSAWASTSYIFFGLVHGPNMYKDTKP